MKKGKFEQSGTKRIHGAKLFALVLALVVMMCSVVGGTVAWLIAESTPVVNTFTYGDVDISLGETDTDTDTDGDGKTDGDGDKNPNTNQYEMIPGQKITKDPTITVQEGSEGMWLFVKLVKSDNFDDFMEYEIADGWFELTGAEGAENDDEVIYFRYISETKAKDGETVGVLADNTVTVKDTVTKKMLNALDADADNTTYPTLTVTATAVQYAGFEVLDDEDKPVYELDGVAESIQREKAQNAWEVTKNNSTTEDATP